MRTRKCEKATPPEREMGMMMMMIPSALFLTSPRTTEEEAAEGSFISFLRAQNFSAFGVPFLQTFIYIDIVRHPPPQPPALCCLLCNVFEVVVEHLTFEVYNFIGNNATDSLRFNPV